MLEKSDALWRCFSEVGRLMIFERVDPPAQARQIRQAGIFESAEEAASLLGAMAWSQSSGTLYLRASDVEIALYLHRGSVLASRSNRQDDRLGDILLDEGVVDRKTLDDCLAEEATAGSRLGSALVRRGLMSTQDVYSWLRKQVERIVDRLLRMGQGTYYLVSPLDMTEVPAMLHIEMQGLLFDALRRLDEERARPKTDEALGELRRSVPVASSKLPPGGLGAIADTYNEALRRLLVAVGADDRERLHADMVSFMADKEVPYADIFSGVRVNKDGTFDREQILKNASSKGDDGVVHLQVGLSELLFFVLFAAGDAVDDSAQSGLHRHVASAMRSLPQAVGEGEDQ